MCAAVGVDTSIDVALMNAIRTQMQQVYTSDEHYTLSCLLFVFIALSLPRLANSQVNSLNSTLQGFNL